MTEPSSPAKQLTGANWAPDLVGALLAVILAVMLGPMLALLLTFASSTPVMIAALVFVLSTSVWLSRLAQHLELSGKRYFQQSYFFLLPLATIFVTTMFVAKLTSLLIATAIERFNQLTGAVGQPGLPAGASSEQMLVFAGALIVAVLLPYIIRARKEFHVTWLLPVLAVIGICLVCAIFFGAILENLTLP